MGKNSLIWKDVAVVALGQTICTAVMVGIFALLGYFDMSVVFGGVAGALISTANYFLLYLFANRAADKAEKQDVAGGQKLIQLSYIGRMVGLLIILVLLAKSGLCNVIALAIPLAFTRPILTVHEWITKKGGGSE